MINVSIFLIGIFQFLDESFLTVSDSASMVMFTKNNKVTSNSKTIN